MPPSKKRRDKSSTEPEGAHVDAATESVSTSEQIKTEDPKTIRPEPRTGFIDKNLGEYRGNGMWVKRN